jgi:hypothetical protein
VAGRRRGQPGGGASQPAERRRKCRFDRLLPFSVRLPDEMPSQIGPLCRCQEAIFGRSAFE